MFSPNLVKVDKISTFDNDEQNEKALSPIIFIEDGNDICTRDEHLLKAFFSIFVKLSDIVISLNSLKKNFLRLI